MSDCVFCDIIAGRSPAKIIYRDVGHLLVVAQQIARQENIAASGYRLVVNTGRGAGQIVYHLHVHVMGG